mmetsp:Transcript_59586/g.96443  ORF Transcript_59586/g.96443 Transcript_59586/m.96443 type:complete len:227 (-) Transcript_59586:7-687(-)
MNVSDPRDAYRCTTTPAPSAVAFALLYSCPRSCMPASAVELALLAAARADLIAVLKGSPGSVTQSLPFTIATAAAVLAMRQPRPSAICQSSRWAWSIGENCRMARAYLSRSSCPALSSGVAAARAASYCALSLIPIVPAGSASAYFQNRCPLSPDAGSGLKNSLASSARGVAPHGAATDTCTALLRCCATAAHVPGEAMKNASSMTANTHRTKPPRASMLGVDTKR